MKQSACVGGKPLSQCQRQRYSYANAMHGIGLWRNTGISHTQSAYVSVRMSAPTLLGPAMGIGVGAYGFSDRMCLGRGIMGWDQTIFHVWVYVLDIPINFNYPK